MVEKSVKILLENRYIPTSGANYKSIYIQGQYEKKSYTLLPSYKLKSIHSLTGQQLGLDYFKKWSKGYSHIGLHYSPNNVFPRLIAKGDLYLNMVQSLEVEIGGSFTKYADQTSVSSIGAGFTYYWRDFFFGYRAQYLIESNINHRAIIRKYLATRYDYIQIGFYKGTDNTVLLTVTSNQVSINTYQFALYKKITKGVQLNLIADVTSSRGEKESTQYFNFTIGAQKWF